ncbi:hypothetical protein D5018_19395 [Parashewanella curva]|uniref:Uncharacterized protein n=1 Tax=Parashewanella curva TaxID=2338552 RepID=A0A3L8PS22_9GAMM|nr:flagellar transcriptional regulator FlhD [Parashewanella curva]RLV58034.1 hypothetical protein D5018_19395 [Parashewanella curva]
MSSTTTIFELNLLYLLAIRELAQNSFEEAQYYSGLDSQALQMITKARLEQLRNLAGSPKFLFRFNGTTQSLHQLIDVNTSAISKFSFAFSLPQKRESLQ